MTKRNTKGHLKGEHETAKRHHQKGDDNGSDDDAQPSGGGSKIPSRCST